MRFENNYLFKNRRKKTAFFLRREKLSSLLISKRENIYYLTGLDIDGSFLLLTSDGKTIIFSDPRYKLQLSSACGSDINCKIYEKTKLSFFQFMASELKKENLKRPALEESVSLYYALRFKKYIPGITHINQIVERVRQVKDECEITLIAKAAKITRCVFRDIEPKVKSGLSEKKIAFEIKKFILEQTQAEAKPSFEPIVLSGQRAAMPHGLPGPKIINDNETVLIDLGVKKDWYNSDLTRTLSVGRISKNSKKIVQAVKDAYLFAAEKIKPGIKAGAVDKAARSFLQKKGYGGYFNHAAGHGIGLEVHEKPSISPGSRDVLKVGMIFTIEPAIYMPGECGARIENMILVTEKGFRVI